MSFWEKKLGVQTAATKKVNTAGGPWWQYESVPELGNNVPKLEEPQHDFSKAQHIKQSSNCPQCGSGNYMKLSQVTSRMGSFEHKRCFSCGYPAVQSMNGMISTSNKPGTPAKQICGISNNYHPESIIGKIG